MCFAGNWLGQAGSWQLVWHDFRTSVPCGEVQADGMTFWRRTACPAPRVEILTLLCLFQAGIES
jgi:hypothetical protein